jgi:hypothetical protein
MLQHAQTVQFRRLLLRDKAVKDESCATANLNDMQQHRRKTDEFGFPGSGVDSIGKGCLPVAIGRSSCREKEDCFDKGLLRR